MSICCVNDIPNIATTLCGPPHLIHCFIICSYVEDFRLCCFTSVSFNRANISEHVHLGSRLRFTYCIECKISRHLDSVHALSVCFSRVEGTESVLDNRRGRE